MPIVRLSARVPHTAVQMFDLVNDIGAYPEFLRWCSGSRVESKSPAELIASVEVGLAGFRQSFRTRNSLTSPAPGSPGKIDMALVSGPFQRLDGVWTFGERTDGGCDVDLTLDYEMKPSPLRMILSAMFEELSRSQMDAFVSRAKQVYGDA
jgi:ribosome-associated toxin RatA of RatAB toxin-antitoxin module